MNKPQELIHRDHNQEEFVSEWNNSLNIQMWNVFFWLQSI